MISLPDIRSFSSTLGQQQARLLKTLPESVNFIERVI